MTRMFSAAALAVVLMGLLAVSVPAATDTDPHMASMDAHPLAGFPMDPAWLHYAYATTDGSAVYPKHPNASAAYKWMDILQEAAARSVDRTAARPTILAREMAIVQTAVFDAWAAYDAKAVGTRLNGSLRRPVAERTQANKEEAIAYAAYNSLLYVYAEDAEWLTERMREMGYDPAVDARDATTPSGIGLLASDAVIEYRRNDGSNQAGDVTGSNGQPYSDYTGYKPVNTADQCIDPDCWQPKVFTRPNGEKFAPGALTPQWGRVKTLGMDAGDQFRPPPQPKIGDPRLKAEVDEVVRYTASLTPMQRAIVEFMRDGPRSTGQSGHWLRFAQDVSRRDQHDLDQDVKMYFAVANICNDTFIACWEAKFHHNSSRPQTLVRHFYAGQTIPGWKGYGLGTGMIPAETWRNYSPDYFLCPPFPAYPSGHSTVSAGASTVLKLFTGSDWFGFCAPRVPGSITHEPLDEVVLLELPTFTATAEMAGISRVMGGYHIQSDNIAALELGRKVANHAWPLYQQYFDGTAGVRD